MGLMSFFKRRSASPLSPEQDFASSEIVLGNLIFTEILPKLPTKSVIRFKCVSKEWWDFITNDADLKKSHTLHHKNTAASRVSRGFSIVAPATKLDNTDQKLVFLTAGENGNLAREFEKPKELNHSIMINEITSCNGLILISKPYLALWNPATGESRVLPDPQIESEEEEEEDNRIPENTPRYGLGFDEESDDHKVIRLKTRDPNHVTLHVFSKKSGSWSKPRSIPGITLAGDRILNGGGAVYFLAEQATHDPKLAIMSFRYDRIGEVRKLTDGPDCELISPEGGFRGLKLMKWKEDSSLAVIQLYPTTKKAGICDFWVMRRNPVGGLFSWSNLFMLSNYYDIRGAWSDRILITRGEGKTELALWDPHKGSQRSGRHVLARPYRRWTFGDAVDFVPSLVSVY